MDSLFIEKDNSKKNCDNNGQQVDRGHLVEEEDPSKYAKPAACMGVIGTSLFLQVCHKLITSSHIPLTK